MNRISKIVGSILGTIGIGLFVYSGYIYFFTPLKQELIQILPAENFEFIAFNSSEYKNITKKFSFYFPQKKDETVVSYFNKEKNKSELIIISKITKNTDTKNLLCEEVKKYNVCTSHQNSETLLTVINFIKNNTTQKTQNNLKTLNDIQIIHDNITNSLFLGTSNFLIKNIDKINNSNRQDIKNLLILLQDNTPYFSGNISENKQIIFNLHKNNNSKIIKNNTKYNTNTLQQITQNISDKNYLYIYSPQQIIKLIHNNKISKNFATQTTQYTYFKEIIKNIFKNKLSYINDIEPLLHEEILITDDFIAISLPTTKIANKFYEKFKNILKEISEEKIPEKKCFTINGENQICEIFPSEKDTTIVETKTSAMFTTKQEIDKNNTEKKEDEENEEIKINTKSILIHENILFLSNKDISKIQNILKRKKENLDKNELNKLKTNIFFQYKNNDIDITGIEKETKIEFIGNFFN